MDGCYAPSGVVRPHRAAWDWEIMTEGLPCRGHIDLASLLVPALGYTESCRQQQKKNVNHPSQRAV